VISLPLIELTEAELRARLDEAKTLREVLLSQLGAIRTRAREVMQELERRGLQVNA
jgi:hypothetical protein